MDCSRRILPVLMELEHRGEESSVVVVAHQAVLRCVFGYLLRRPMEDVPFIKIPQHAIMQVGNAPVMSPPHLTQNSLETWVQK